jgi:hypothetical protein
MTALPPSARPHVDEAALPWTGLTVGQARLTLTTWEVPRRLRRSYETAIVAIGLDLLVVLDTKLTDPSVNSVALETLPNSGGTLADARSLLSGWHFAKESLTDREQRVLYVVEGLLRLVDERSPRGYLH